MHSRCRHYRYIAVDITLAFALVLVVLPCCSQSFRGSIDGTVTDPNGAIVPSVTVDNKGTGITHNALSSSSGEIIFQDLPVGSYFVEAIATGFNPTKVSLVMVSAGIVVTVPIQLHVTWFNSSAFTNPALGTYGNQRRNQFYNPGFEDVDLSVFKNTKVNNRISTQFRAEMFNVFNRINFAPVGFPQVDAGGTIGSTIGTFFGAPGIGPGEPFNVQFALKILI